MQALDCDELNADVDAQSFLRADYSISCNWDVDGWRPSWLAYTLIMLLLWPVGVPIYFAYLFHLNQKGVRILRLAQQRYESRAAAVREGVALVAEDKAREASRSSKRNSISFVRGDTSEPSLEPRTVQQIEKLLRHGRKWDPRDAPTGRLRHYESDLLRSLREGMHVR